MWIKSYVDDTIVNLDCISYITVDANEFVCKLWLAGNPVASPAQFLPIKFESLEKCRAFIDELWSVIDMTHEHLMRGDYE